ncbi:hypothetical protein MACK_000030 [Theileria orientalis]|uniref:Uncharacterized protein n=1 Tax=Theileria orientalis TaxID=68886 RepID=A0A976M8S6_THEOR|nr:hypothetical protein MACK_000030 [Theileria orientalis]
MSDVAGLRLYINCDSTKKENNVSNDFEIKLYNDKGTDQKIIYYKPNPDPHGPEDYVYVYFYDSDSVPLLLYQGGNWYKPKSKIEYLDKWIEETGLKDSKPKKLNQFLSDNKILIQLKKINKELNEIVLDYRVNYGLISNEKQMSSGFDTTRIVVIKPEQLKRYRKISHSTKNKGDIGEIKKKDLILEDNEKGKSLSDVISRQMTATFNTLVCYYHTSDLNYELPLLLCIGSSDAENGKSLFYERVNVTENSKWKKIDKIGTFQEEQGLSNKIIDIYYNFSKSVVIEIEKQGIIGYDFKLVDNVGLGSPSSSGINSKIFVFEKHSLLSDSDYTCFEHSIPLMQLSNNHFKIGGLKFYISSTEIFTFLDDNSSSSPIYYEPGKYNVCVYFYHCDTVPLLVVYNNQYYKPKNKNEYFSKWVRVTNIQDLSTQLITQLDSINAELNEVNIMKTSNRNSYGINGHKNGNFSPARINVKTCKNDFFRKVTHTTLNKFGVGKILYNGTQIKSIKKSNFYNEVSVYYLNSDIKYIRPLLISLGSVNSVNFESKWYSITDTEGTLWSNDTNTLNYNTYLKIKKKLIVLHSKYLVPLNVRLENQNHYNNTFTTPDDIHNGVINIDRLRTNNNFSVTNYRCLHHQLYAYYEENEGAIKSKWSLTQSELNFELTLNLFESKLTLIDLQQTLIPLLKYTETDFRDKNNITVYFYEPEIIDSPIVDTVPLMFKFKNRFFVPISKESYFHQWKEVDFQVSDVPIINAIKARLDTINSMLNEIDLSKISNYGIAFCGKYPFFKKGELSTKRIDVSIFSNSKHLIRVHNTSNKFKISKVKPISKCSFDEVSSYLKNKNIVQVAVIYKIGYTTHPELILLNEYSSNYGYLTYLYYYKFEIKPKPFEYRFQNVPNGLSLIDKLTEVEKYQWDTSEHLRPIIRLLREISRKKLVPRIQFPDYDSTDCRKTSHPVLNDDQCEEPFPDESLEKPGQKAKDPDSDHPPGTGSSDPSHDILTLRDVFDYIKKHPEVVYGPGSAVTIAASAYPLYKLILVYKNK